MEGVGPQSDTSDPDLRCKLGMLLCTYLSGEIQLSL